MIFNFALSLFFFFSSIPLYDPSLVPFLLFSNTSTPRKRALSTKLGQWRVHAAPLSKVRGHARGHISSSLALLPLVKWIYCLVLGSRSRDSQLGMCSYVPNFHITWASLRSRFKDNRSEYQKYCLPGWPHHLGVVRRFISVLNMG